MYTWIRFSNDVQQRVTDVNTQQQPHFFQNVFTNILTHREQTAWSKWCFPAFAENVKIHKNVCTGHACKSGCFGNLKPLLQIYKPRSTETFVESNQAIFTLICKLSSDYVAEPSAAIHIHEHFYRPGSISGSKMATRYIREAQEQPSNCQNHWLNLINSWFQATWYFHLTRTSNPLRKFTLKESLAILSTHFRNPAAVT